MSGENYTNTASTATAAAPIGPSDTTATLASFTGWPSPPFYGEFEKGTASAEIVRVTGVAGSAITAMTRGQGGTAATTHGAGASFEHVVPADPFNRFEQHQAASTSVHGVSGSVVGTSGAQTVQDKLFRGALRSNNTDALPAGITSSVETVADNSSARDGHVHTNTSGHADRRGFLLTQSGTPRFQAFNDGTVQLTPGTSTRPGFRNEGTTRLDGATTMNAALTVSAGGANVTGGVTVPTGGVSVTAGGLTVAAGTTAVQAATCTTLSTSSTIHAGSTIDTDANLIVDGSSTLTGGVSMGAGLSVAQGITSWGGRVIASVSSSAAVTSPTTGDVIYDRSDSMLKRWSGSAWVDMMPGDSATSHLGEYTLGNTSATQVLTGGTTVALGVGGTVTRSTPTVTVGTSSAAAGTISNAAFTLNRGGEYEWEWTVAWTAPTTDSLLMTYVALDSSTSGTWYGADRWNSGATSLDLYSSSGFTSYFAAGTKLDLYVLSNKNVTVNNGHSATRLTIKYRGA